MEREVKCPRCGSVAIQPLCDGKGTALFQCVDCRTFFGEENDSHTLSSLVTRFELEVHSLHEGGFLLRFFGPVGRRQFRMRKGSRETCSGKLSEEEWQAFCNGLFQKAYLDKWKANYFDPSILDGTTWNITVSFEKKHALSIHGCNGYPIYWNELMDIVGSYLEQGKIEAPKIAE